MALISKRLRTHRKKYNRITEVEESISQGKTLNKEQKETILSKPIVTALIQELEKLLILLPPPFQKRSLASLLRKTKCKRYSLIFSKGVSHTSYHNKPKPNLPSS